MHVTVTEMAMPQISSMTVVPVATVVVPCCRAASVVVEQVSEVPCVAQQCLSSGRVWLGPCSGYVMTVVVPSVCPRR